jgi:hypothetical protein
VLKDYGLAILSVFLFMAVPPISALRERVSFESKKKEKRFKVATGECKYMRIWIGGSGYIFIMLDQWVQKL